MTLFFVFLTIVIFSVYLFLRTKNKTKTLTLLENKYQSIFELSPIGTGIVSSQGYWLQANKALCDILGMSEESLKKMDFQSTLHPDDQLENLHYINQLTEENKPYIQLEQRFITHNNQVTWVSLTISLIRNDKKAPLYYIVQVQDINDKRKNENELSYKAYFDSLTGLFNRNQLEHGFQSSITTAFRHQKSFAIFFIDLDHFKKINDQLGHDIGDELLKIIGERLKHNIRKTDIAARIGGDEFILVLNGINTPETAAIFAEKILDLLTKPIKIKEHELLITASIGISFYPLDGEDFNSLIKSADLALYKAKELGRHNYQFCTREMNNEIKEKINFKNALKNALEKDEFHLVYLPKLNIKTNTISGFEALLRWKNAIYGDVSPNKIIPLADEMGVMSQLSEWIIGTALQKAKNWQQYGSLQPTKIAINISTRHFIDEHFVDNILQMIHNAHFAADHLQLEINENLIMRDPNYSLKIIHKLKSHGIQIIIDNFGTGYSSLNYLQQFSVDYIKIDRHFTQMMHLNDQQVLFLIAIVDLAKNLNIKTLAEGVESKEQVELLKRIGCDEIQGFFISPPILAEHIPAFLETHAKTEQITGLSSE